MFILKISNSLAGIYLALLISIPISIFYIIDYKINKKRRKKIDLDLTFMIKSLIKILGILSAILFIINIVFNNKTFNSFLLTAFYFCSIIAFIIFFNYFSIRNDNYRKNIVALLESLIDFFKEKFILHLMLFIFCWLFKNNSNLLLGIVGSYVFFFLEQLNKSYIEKKAKKKPSILFIVIQFITNFLILLYLINIEIFYNAQTKEIITFPSLVDILMDGLMVMIAFLINYNYDYLINLLDKILKNVLKFAKK